MDPRVTELHCIMPLGNVPSVIKHGILSHERAARLQHESVALQEIQDLRAEVRVPGGLRLHQYANLYFHARNPMLFKRLNEAGELCVLRVSTGVLTQEGVVLASENAASRYVRFLPPSAWPALDFEAIYALDWRHPEDRIAYYQHKARKCAEVLVPERVEPRWLLGAYAMDSSVAARLREGGFPHPITIDPVLFFH